MGMWFCKICAKLLNGKVVTHTKRFKHKGMLSAHLNTMMGSGKYLSCGAGMIWTERPRPKVGNGAAPTSVD